MAGEGDFLEWLNGLAKGDTHEKEMEETGTGDTGQGAGRGERPLFLQGWERQWLLEW